MLPADAPFACRRSRRRVLPAAAALALALAVHAGLLGGPQAGAAAPPAGPPALIVRTVEAPAVEPPAVAAAPRPVARDAAIAKTSAPKPPADADGTAAPPVYRTKLAPPVSLRYDMRKGAFTGTGWLHWKPAGDRYEARLEAHVAGVHVLTETSSGVVDAHGIAPLRYTDVRVRRGTQAANFQRDKGRITYSGPPVEYPLLAGAQDRLSWMMQIGAVLNAQPKLATPGGRVSFQVSGAHGDAEVWTFRQSGTEQLRGEAGPVRAVKFTREPRKAYDKLVEVWLDPGRHHLPVRARFTATAGGEVFELLLRDMQSP